MLWCVVQVTPPPGFGPPASSDGTPSASAHTSIESQTVLWGGEAAPGTAARGVMDHPGSEVAQAGPPQQQQQQAEGYSPFGAFGGGGSLFSSFGSSSSLMERLPSAGDLLAGGSEVGEAGPLACCTCPWVQGGKGTKLAVPIQSDGTPRFSSAALLRGVLQ